MTREELKERIYKNDLPGLFSWLHKNESSIPKEYQNSSNRLIQEYIQGIKDQDFIDRLIVFVDFLPEDIFENTSQNEEVSLQASQKQEIFQILETTAKNFDNLTEDEKKELFELKQRAYELFQELDLKFAKDFPNIIFDRITSQTTLRAQELNEIRGFITSKEAKYYEKCVVVSALTLSLLQEMEVDRLELLINFVLEGENQVWQRALIGIVLALHNRTNKLKAYPKALQKIEDLKNIHRVQNALLIVNQAYNKFQKDIEVENTIVDLLQIFSKMRENDFFEKPQHWFLPFYPENEKAREYVQSKQDKHDIDTNEFMKLLDNSIAIGNADKYAICLHLDRLNKEQIFGGTGQRGLINVLKDQNQRLNQLIQSLAIPQDFLETSLYEQYLMDLYQFSRHFPENRYRTNILKSQELYQKNLLELIAEETAQLRIEAQYHLNVKNYQQAQTLYKKLVALMPDVPEIWYNLGVVNYKLQLYPDAVKAYTQVVKLDATDHKAWNNLGTAHFMNDEPEKATSAYQKAIQIKPDKDEAWYNLGYLLFTRQKFAEAAQVFENVIKINDKRADAWYNLGAAYMMSGIQTKAIEVFSHTLSFGETEDIWYNLGMCYINLKQYEEALNAYQQAHRLNPTMIEALVNIGYIYLILKNLDKSEKYLEDAQKISTEPNDAILVNLGHIALIKGDQIGAIEFYKGALQVTKPEIFFEGIQGDFQYLEPQGVTKETFDNIIAQLSLKTFPTQRTSRTP